MFQLTAVAASLAAAGAMPAQATPFGPATSAISFLFSPTVGTTPPTGSATLTGAIFSTANTGSLTGTSTGAGAGSIGFSTTSGVTTAEVLAGLFKFNDGTGGFYSFDLASVLTSSFLVTPTLSTSISLFLLGTMGDSHLDEAATLTSITLTLNQTGASAFSGSASLANPPAPPPVPTPEPATLSLLGLGLFGLGLARRRSV